MSPFDRDRLLATCCRGAGLGLALFLLTPGPAPAVPTPQNEDPSTGAETAAGASHPECAECQGKRCRQQGREGEEGRQGEEGRGGEHGAMGSGSRQPAMQNAHFLIDNHEHLKRTVEEIPKGVRTRTLADDPELTARLREHVRQMAELLDEGGSVRKWDPLFREIFDHRDAIEIEIRDIENGVEVVETSEDEQVVALIQAHAHKVEEFVARGRAACHEETPLPAGYSDAGR